MLHAGRSGAVPQPLLKLVRSELFSLFQKGFQVMTAKFSEPIVKTHRWLYELLPVAVQDIGKQGIARIGRRRSRPGRFFLLLFLLLILFLCLVFIIKLLIRWN